MRDPGCLLDLGIYITSVLAAALVRQQQLLENLELLQSQLAACTRERDERTRERDERTRELEERTRERDERTRELEERTRERDELRQELTLQPKKKTCYIEHGKHLRLLGQIKYMQV